MTELFRNNSPGALTREQAVELEKKRAKERARQAKALAAQGRGGDTELAHLTPGEIILPEFLQTPELLSLLHQAAAANNIPFDSLRIGSRKNRINPNTGLPEFDYYTDYDRESFYIPTFDDLPGLSNLPDISSFLDPGQLNIAPPFASNGAGMDGVTVTGSPFQNGGSFSGNGFNLIGAPQADNGGGGGPPLVIDGPPTEGITVKATPLPGFMQLPQGTPASGYYNYGTPGPGRRGGPRQAQYGVPAAVNLINEAGKQWSATGAKPFGAGNMSLEDGSPYGHTGHQANGTSIDIRPVRSDGQQVPGTTWKDPNYDRNATQALIDILRATGGVRNIFFNDPNIAGVTPLGGHDDHIHVEVDPYWHP